MPFGGVTNKKSRGRGVAMMGSYGWHGDGDGDGAASLPPQRYGGRFILPCPPGSVVGSPASFQVYRPSPSSSSSSSAVVVGGAAVAKAAAASRIHSLAERGRRERINGHLSTLRRMIPNADKMDKATLLRSVIHEVRVLKRKAADVSKHLTVPAEVNQVSVECDEGNELPADKCCPLIKASICCDDRPDLYADIIEAFHRLRLRAVRADTASLGGRVRHAFVLRRAGGGGGGEDACLSSLMESTRQLLGKVASVEDAASSSLLTKRRRRLFHSHHHSYVPC